MQRTAERRPGRLRGAAEAIATRPASEGAGGAEGGSAALPGGDAGASGEPTGSTTAGGVRRMRFAPTVNTERRSKQRGGAGAVSPGLCNPQTLTHGLQTLHLKSLTLNPTP